MHITRCGFFVVWVAIWMFPLLAHALAQDEKRELIPAGKFFMGTEAGSEMERPVHTVWVDAFWIDRHEVSNRAYKNFWPGHRPSLLSGCPECPATLVTWFQAEAYCSHRGGHLPTEAEWEKAARGPKGFAYSYAPVPDTQKGRFGFPMRAGALAVETLAVNEFGLHHMSGNVWEWVGDWFAPYPGKSGNNPRGPVKGWQKGVRGGGWYNPSFYAHVGMRFKLSPAVKLNSLGFRCAYDAEKKTP